MNCQTAEDNLILATYGELPDELMAGLEQHLGACEMCAEHLAELQAMQRHMAELPVLEPSPNLLAHARMRLDEALDVIPPHGLLTRLRSNLFGWLGHVQSAPALTTLLVGMGFLAGNFTYRYQVGHAPRLPGVVVLSNPTAGSIGNVSGIVKTPDSEMVQVSYSRVVPETMEGSLDEPQIRELLILGMNAAANPSVRAQSVGLIAQECRTGHSCFSEATSEPDGKHIRLALLTALRSDKSSEVRLRAIDGLQPFVGQDQRVRNAVLGALMHDPSASVRTKAISMLEPVQSDSSVRQVLRSVSTRDENPYIRTASFNALQNAAAIE